MQTYATLPQQPNAILYGLFTTIYAINIAFNILPSQFNYIALMMCTHLHSYLSSL
jgi:hypothetical protein